MTTFVDSYRFTAAGGGFTDPEDIAWHSLFWAEGTAFTALAYSDTDVVTTWPNETAETDLTPVVSGSGFKYDAVNANYNNQPTCKSDSNDHMEADFGSALSQTYSVVVVGSIGATASSFATIFDNTGSNPATIYRNGGGAKPMVMNAGGGTISSVSAWNSSPHLWVAVFAGGSSKFILDGTEYTGSVGTNSLAGLTLACNRLGDTGSTAHSGDYALAGVIAGDLTANDFYSDLEAWVASHYGITIT